MSETREKMTKTEYLYGTYDVPKVPKELIEQRLSILDDTLEKLLSVHYISRDSYRINAILKAINFWKTINNH